MFVGFDDDSPGHWIHNLATCHLLRTINVAFVESRTAHHPPSPPPPGHSGASTASPTSGLEPTPTPISHVFTRYISTFLPATPSRRWRMHIRISTTSHSYLRHSMTTKPVTLDRASQMLPTSNALTAQHTYSLTKNPRHRSLRRHPPHLRSRLSTIVTFIHRTIVSHPNTRGHKACPQHQVSCGIAQSRMVGTTLSPRERHLPHGYSLTRV
jgi:hypothetical protein